MWAVIAFGSFSCVLQYGPYFDPLSERNMRSVWKYKTDFCKAHRRSTRHACMRSDGHEP